MVNPNRPQAAQDLITQFDSKIDIILSDDGLQHYKLHRDVEILVIDLKRQFGNGFCLPAGPLREPKSRCKTVDLIFSPELIPLHWKNLQTQQVKPLDYFKNQSAHAITGIGNPKRFFEQLEKLNISITKHAYPDHYDFKPKDLDLNTHTAPAPKTNPKNLPILLTEKDGVKCQKFAPENTWALVVETRFSEDFKTSFLSLLTY
jgi:tetraacyldisaccharide 4'-kinase